MVECEIVFKKSEVTGFINIVAKRSEFHLYESVQNGDYIISELTKLLKNS